MHSKKKIIGNGIFLLSVFLLTLYGVFHGEDLEKMFAAIKGADVKWLVPGVLFVVLFIWGESIIIWYMMRSFGIFLKKRICFLFSSVGFFFSCITPSASGGQPMQIYYMRKERIPIPVSTVILMVVTITYKLVLVIIGLGVLMLGREFCCHYLGEILPVYYLGLALNVACVGFMIVLLFHPVLVERFLVSGLGWMERFKIMKRRRARREKLLKAMQVYRETADYLRKHRTVIVLVMLITFIQRLILFGVTWTVYRAFRMSGVDAADVVLLQAVISVSVDMLPLPGGMGISESLFLKIFRPVFGTFLLPAMVLSRGIGYYSQLLISAVFTVTAQLYYTWRSRMKNETGLQQGVAK